MPQPPTILLRPSWQVQNICNIAHKPGMPAVLEKFAPEARVILWYGGVGQGVESMLRERFPTLRFVPAADGAEKHSDYLAGPTDLSATQAMGEADLLLHGSGPALVGEPGGGVGARSTETYVNNFSTRHACVTFRLD